RISAVNKHMSLAQGQAGVERIYSAFFLHHGFPDLRRPKELAGCTFKTGELLDIRGENDRLVPLHHKLGLGMARAAAGRDGLRCGCGQRRAPEECSVWHRQRAKLVVSRKEKTILREGEGSRCLAALFVFIEGTTQVGGDGDFIKSGGPTF